MRRCVKSRAISAITKAKNQQQQQQPVRRLMKRTILCQQFHPHNGRQILISKIVLFGVTNSSINHGVTAFLSFSYLAFACFHSMNLNK